MDHFNPYALDDSQLATRSTRSFALLMLCLMPITLIIRINAGLDLSWIWYLGLTTIAAAYLLTSRFPRLKVKYNALLIILMVIFNLLPASQTAHLAGLQNITISYFAAYKIMAIAIALMAPFPYFLGYAALSFCLFAPPLQVLFISPEVIRASGQYEPWLTMCYPLAGFLVLHNRISTLKLHATLIESQAKEKNLRDFADVAMALRDLTNTPLQSLDLIIDMLREEKIEPKQASELLNKTVARLRELMLVLSDQQKKITRQQVQHSINSMDIIRQRFGSYNPENKAD